jgi:hypothetical protein
MLSSEPRVLVALKIDAILLDEDYLLCLSRPSTLGSKVWAAKQTRKNGSSIRQSPLAGPVVLSTSY